MGNGGEIYLSNMTIPFIFGGELPTLPPPEAIGSPFRLKNGNWVLLARVNIYFPKDIPLCKKCRKKILKG